MATLAELIHQAKGDDSYDVLARRGGLSSSQLHKFANGRNQVFPEPDTIVQLANACRVEPEAIIIAASEGLGFPLPVSQHVTATQLLPPGIGDLPPWALRSLVALARDLVEHTIPEPPLSEAALRERAEEADRQIRAVHVDRSHVDSQ